MADLFQRVNQSRLEFAQTDRYLNEAPILVFGSSSYRNVKHCHQHKGLKVVPRWPKSWQRSVSSDTAFRLGLYLGTPPAYWMDLQRDFDLAKVEVERGEEIRTRIRTSIRSRSQRRKEGPAIGRGTRDIDGFPTGGNRFHWHFGNREQYSPGANSRNGFQE